MQESLANSEAAEELDCLIAELYSQLNSLAPEQRIWVVSRLIQLGDLRIPCLDTPQMDQDLKRQLGSALSAIDGTIAVIHERLTAANLSLTYLAANYWSPAVKHRQSIVARARTLGHEARRNRFAIAFFAITFDVKKSSELCSIVQYLALEAKRRRSVITLDASYEQSAVNPAAIARKGRIFKGAKPDFSLAELPNGFNLNVAGTGFVNSLTDFIDTFTANVSVDEMDSDRDLLREYLLQGEALPRYEARPKPPWLRRVLDDYRQIQAKATGRLTDTQRQELNKSCDKMRALFADYRLSADQVGFFLSMQVVWKQAFGGKYLYAFPTTVNDRCCVLTAGADEPIAERGLLASFGRSLFANALLLDYGSSREIVQRRHYQSLVANNIPNVMLSPATAELKWVRASVEAEHESELVAGESPDPHTKTIVTQLHSLQTLCEHYELLLGRFRFITREAGSRRLQTTPEEVGFAVIFTRLQSVFGALKQRILSKDLRERLELKNASPQETNFYTDVDMITEVLINFIVNAMDCIDPDRVTHWPGSVNITLCAQRISNPAGMDTIRLCIRDCGHEYQPEANQPAMAAIEAFAGVSEGNWGELLEKYLSDQDSVVGSHESLGIGTPLCAAYVRQLLWDPNYGVAGSISMGAAADGVGTEVLLTLPAGRGTSRTVSPYLPRTSPASIAIAGRTFLLTEDDAFVAAWTQAIPGAVRCGEAAEVPDDAHVVIDSDWGSADFGKLNAASLLELMDLFDESADLERLPRSALALMHLRHRCNQGNTGRCILFPCNNPTASLIQELLSAGADWVCSSRLEPPRLDAVYGALKADTRMPRSRNDEALDRLGYVLAGKKLLIIDGNRYACMTLRRRLETLANLDFVGADLPGNRFRVDDALALKRFLIRHADGSLGAVVTDLVLGNRSEQEIELQGRANFPGLEPAIGMLRSMRELAPDLPIIVLSNLVRMPEVHLLLDPLRVYRYPKSPWGYRALEQMLVSRHP